MAKRFIPSFIYVGAPKCASTWIYKALDAHPQVYVPPAKGAFFFDKYYDKGFDWYAGFFAKASSEARAIGELSHNYLHSREAALRIFKDLPHVKLFASIRNPLERFVSAYMFVKRHNLAKGDFEDTLKRFPHLLNMGRYYEHLSRYKELFGEKRFRVFLFCDLKKDSYAFAREIYRFVDVDPTFNYMDAEKKTLPASKYRVGWLALGAKKLSLMLRDRGFGNLAGRIKNSFIPKLLYLPVGSDEKMTLTNKQKAFLIRYYHQDVTKTGKFLGRDLSHWIE
jgi:hypothetical protein